MSSAFKLLALIPELEYGNSGTGRNIMSQGNLPLRVAVNISAMTVFHIVLVSMLMCFCSGCSKHLLLVALKSNSQALSLESSLLSQRFYISSSCQDFAAVGQIHFGGVREGVSIAVSSLPVCT